MDQERARHDLNTGEAHLRKVQEDPLPDVGGIPGVRIVVLPTLAGIPLLPHRIGPIQPPGIGTIGLLAVGVRVVACRVVAGAVGARRCIVIAAAAGRAKPTAPSRR